MPAGLPQSLATLLNPRAYPHPVAEVQLVETHVSWVLLTGTFAYKIKRPVRYPFVDLRSPERRAFFCSEEVRLNARFAPELYLDVCLITVTAGEARIGGEGEVIEHAVRMRQFDRAEELDRLLLAGRIEPVELDAFGRDLADIHAGLPVASGPDLWGEHLEVRRALVRNVDECSTLAARIGTRDAIEALRTPWLAAIDSAEPVIIARRREGRVRECHGDLHSRNVVRHAGRLIAFDCMEFEPAFRWTDVAEDVAFLMMDLQVLQAAPHAQAFLAGYLARSGDYHACRVLRLYGAHRALVRAKVAAIEAVDAGAEDARAAALARHQSYVERARSLIARTRPRLFLMFGLSGSGKTWLARQLAPLLGAVHVRSDVERKRLGGLAERASSGSTLEGGLYAPSTSAQVYERLARCALDALAGGFDVIVDATFQRREDRARLRDLASQAGVAMQVIHCRAPQEVLERRIAGRARLALDASEADREVLDWQRIHLQPLAADENLSVIDADTTRPALVSELSERLKKTGR